MPLHRANARNPNAVPPVPDLELSNAKFKATKVHNYVRMNPVEFLGSENNEDPQNFLEEIEKIFEVDSDKIREQAQENKKARTQNYDYFQQKSGCGNSLQSQQKCSSPTPSSASFPSSENRFYQKVRASGSNSQRRFSGTKTYPTCPKCDKKNPCECLAGNKGCFRCG
ncbi:uncharacterized protein [Solanum lycopersicum]|uniref:uncharacterized protein n=1 Tax=Solanum lycopersicum TaxID=4081 RepID=UPI0037499C2C